MSEIVSADEAAAEQAREGGSALRVRQLLALNKAAVQITGELELDNLLQRIVDTARVVVGCEYAALGVLGDDGFIAYFPTSGISDVDREKIGAPPRGHGLLGVMLRAGRMLRISNLNDDPRRVGFPPHHPPMTSLLGVPIFVQGRLMGDLYLSNKIGSAEFSEEDEWLVQLLATHATTALTNAQLHGENMAALAQVRRERAHSEALFRVTQAINTSVDPQEVISLIVQSAAELLAAAGAALYMLEQKGNAAPGPSSGPHFVARYALGLEETMTTTPAQLQMERTIAGRAVRSGQTQAVPNTDLESGVILPRLRGRTLRSLVAVPLVAKGQMLGVLSIYYDQPAAFDAEDIRVLEAFAAVASTAAHNSQLYEEARLGRQVAEREQERLRELEQMKDEFLSTAAHELRTPLTTILMSAGLAHEQLGLLNGAGPVVLNPRLVDLVGLVVESSQRMQSLVNDLLDLTRLEQGRTTLLTTEIDLREALRASVESVRPLFTARRQTLSLHLPESRCTVRGDRQRLEQVFVNLLSNANKYSPPGAQVELRVVTQGGNCEVRVRDGGAGVPEDERERIFERFYRSSVHRTDRTASTGLGLPIARQIAEMHGGRLWVEPAPGTGSIFVLSLPLDRSLPAAGD